MYLRTVYGKKPAYETLFCAIRVSFIDEPVIHSTTEYFSALNKNIFIFIFAAYFFLFTICMLGNGVRAFMLCDLVNWRRRTVFQLS